MLHEIAVPARVAIVRVSSSNDVPQARMHFVAIRVCESVATPIRLCTLKGRGVIVHMVLSAAFNCSTNLHCITVTGRHLALFSGLLKDTMAVIVAAPEHDGCDHPTGIRVARFLFVAHALRYGTAKALLQLAEHDIGPVADFDEVDPAILEVVVLVVRVSEVLPRVDLHGDVSEVAIATICFSIETKELLDLGVVVLWVPLVSAKERQPCTSTAL